jgi:hypothetical protein
MCVLTATRHVTEALVRFEDSTVYVAYELACGCVGLRPASLADLERGLPLLEGQTPAEPADEPAAPVLALVA